MTKEYLMLKNVHTFEQKIISLFKNPDFDGVNYILFLGIFGLVVTFIDLVPLLKEPWFVARNFEIRGATYMLTPITIAAIYFSFTCLFLFPALFRARKKCCFRIENKIITREEGVRAFNFTIVAHVVLVIFIFLLYALGMILLKLLF